MTNPNEMSCRITPEERSAILNFPDPDKSVIGKDVNVQQINNLDALRQNAADRDNRRSIWARVLIVAGVLMSATIVITGIITIVRWFIGWWSSISAGLN